MMMMMIWTLEIVGFYAACFRFVWLEMVPNVVSVSTDVYQLFSLHRHFLLHLLHGNSCVYLKWKINIDLNDISQPSYSHFVLLCFVFVVLLTFSV